MLPVGKKPVPMFKFPRGEPEAPTSARKVISLPTIVRLSKPGVLAETASLNSTSPAVMVLPLAGPISSTGSPFLL